MSHYGCPSAYFDDWRRRNDAVEWSQHPGEYVLGDVLADVGL